jgi:hypothetical protein
MGPRHSDAWCSSPMCVAGVLGAITTPGTSVPDAPKPSPQYNPLHTQAFILGTSLNYLQKAAPGMKYGTISHCRGVGVHGGGSGKKCLYLWNSNMSR